MKEIKNENEVKTREEDQWETSIVLSFKRDAEPDKMIGMGAVAQVWKI